MKKALVAIFAMACIALAEPHTHDGFFMNYAFGAGYQSFKNNASKSSGIEISGVSSEFDFKIGLAINPEIIVHLSLNSVDNANDIEHNGMEIDFDGISTVFLGLGTTHYTSNNIFFGISVGLVQVNPIEEAEFDFKKSNHGFGFEGEVGKEWWISDNWGLGAALAFTYFKCSDNGVSQSAFGINLLLSLTYN